LNANAGFSLLLGNDRNKKYSLTHPILVESSNGFMIKLNGEDIVKFGLTSEDKRAFFYEDIMMSQHFIGDVRDPRSPQDAATQKYVENAVTDCAPKSNLI
jgi:hypothetical protein